jgi:hypothetical protein
MRRKRSESTVMEGISPKESIISEKKKKEGEERRKKKKGNPRIEEVGMMGQEVGGGIGWWKIEKAWAGLRKGGQVRDCKRFLVY